MTEQRFTRGELCKKLGGSIQTLLVRYAAFQALHLAHAGSLGAEALISHITIRVSNSQGPIAKELGINAYLCPNIHQNPWCPKAPGEHGFMFVGLGHDRDTFLEEEQRHVFVGQKGSQKLSMT